MTAAPDPTRRPPAPVDAGRARADVIPLRLPPSVRPRSLAEARILRGLTRSELARTLHISRTSVALWERNERRPARANWTALAAALGVPVHDLARLVAGSPPARLDGVPLPSLAAARRRARLSQRSLAATVGVAPSTLSMWETAGVRVPDATAARLAEVLGTSVTVLAASPPSTAEADPRPLRQLRRSAAMSQTEAAAHLGIAVGSLARYEARERRPPLAVARRMVRAYGQPTADVLALCEIELAPMPPARHWCASDVPAGLRAARLAAGLTKAALGRAVGRSDQAVGSWESGRSLPRADVRPRLEAVLGLPAGKIAG